MPYLSRSTPLALLALWLAFPAGGNAAEYKRADANFYPPGAVLKVDSSAVILDAGEYRQKGDSYFTSSHRKAPAEIYIQGVHEWLEPITPPSMPASLGIASDAMQIRETQGDVQVALPTNPTSFAPATEQMSLPDGAIVKTGANGSAAVLFGGVNSVRLASNSQATVQQTVTPALRTTRVNLTSGVAFSKVGLRPGEKQDYQVQTPFGTAAAKGTDFVCLVLPARTDVWVAQGTVQLTGPNGQIVGSVKASGKGPLQLLRFPQIDDARQSLTADAETLTMAMNFIPMVDLKIKALRDRRAQGTKLTAQEVTYLGLIKHVPALIKLALVEPPAPPPAPPKPKPVVVRPPAPAVLASTPMVPQAHDTLALRPETSTTPVHTAAPVKTSNTVSNSTLINTKPISSKSKPKIIRRHPVTAPSSSSLDAVPLSTGPNDTIP